MTKVKHVEGRTQKSIRNIKYGVIFQIINVIFSFINRSLMIKYLGLDAVSIHGLFWELISMISMAELGIGIAITYNLYEPLTKNDTKKIIQLMNMYKRAYQFIAVITFVIGIVVCIFIPYIVNGIAYSDKYIRIIFMLYVIQSTQSYLFTYKLTLLSADQNKYIYVRIQTILRIVGAMTLITIMIATQNFIYYLVTDILVGLITNVCSSITVDKKYPYINKNINKKVEKIDKKEQKNIFSNVKDVFIKKLSGQITNSTDNILISILVGTNLVGYYANYSSIFSVFVELEKQISSGFLASLGNLIITEDKNKVENIINRLTGMYFIFAVVSSAGVYVCTKPFITIWLGSKYVMNTSVVFVGCLNLFLNLVKGPIWQAIDAAGLFQQDKYISIIGNIVNLVISLIAGYKFGMIGIFAGTTLTLIINLFMKIILFYKYELQKEYKVYLVKWIKMIVGAVIVLILTDFLCNKFVVESAYLEFFKNGVLAVLVSILITMIGFPEIFNMDDLKKIIVELKTK